MELSKFNTALRGGDYSERGLDFKKRSIFVSIYQAL